jgi:hypothetical protein
MESEDRTSIFLLGLSSDRVELAILAPIIEHGPVYIQRNINKNPGTNLNEMLLLGK